MSGPAKVVKTKLFIGNLDPATQSSELHELFSPFGNVLESSVIKDYGFIHYGSIEEAEKAAVALNNKEFHGKRLRVELSTSTVRHRPGQPEPASALKHSRNRNPGRGNNNGVHRYNAGPYAGGVGPIRHTSSGWSRHDIRPYDSAPVDPRVYDRARPYDIRSDPRHYYEDEQDNGYGPRYDTSSYGGSISSESPGVHLYRDLPPHARADGYGSSRPYDRHLSAPPVDPYYGNAVPQGPPAPPPPPPAVSEDPYQNYAPYEKYYASRPRDPEFPGQRDYSLYSNYRNDPYAAPSSHGSLRHDLPVGVPQPSGVYPSPHRAHQSYGSGSFNAAQYYGAQRR